MNKDTYNHLINLMNTITNKDNIYEQIDASDYQAIMAWIDEVAKEYT